MFSDVSNALNTAHLRRYKDLPGPAQDLLLYFYTHSDAKGEVITTVNKIIDWYEAPPKYVYSGLYFLRDCQYLQFEGSIVSNKYIKFKFGNFGDE